jgi:uncharacterized membrane protein
MPQILAALSFWLHSLATVVFIGHHLLFSLIYLPAFAQNQGNPANRAILSAISKRSRTWMYASLGVFVVTGVFLMYVDPSYLGIGNFNNVWSVMMLVKHILILGMVGMGFWYNGLMRVGPLMSSNTGATQALLRFRQYNNLMAVTGVLILLLTAVSQAQ